ncbi:hypothetical protein P154DRAFT_611260, partial [Amniculicola lignicola CBS 123094]
VQPHGRGTLSLLYSCLFTIYICTWYAVHLNVPADDDTSLAIVLRKVKWMGVAILAPEYAVTNAFQQSSPILAKGKQAPVLYHLEWTMTHAYLIEMGRLSAELSNGARVRLSPGRFRELTNDGMRLPFISEKEIEDRSKASWMTKLLACVQISWFVMELIGRAIQRLPTSSLEAFTLAIVACTLVQYFLWLKKPLDVQTPIIINLANFYNGHILKPGNGLPENAKYTCKRSYDVSQLASERHRNLNPFTLWNPARAYFMMFVASIFGACHLLAWHWYFPSPAERMLWRITSIACVALPAAFCMIQVLRGPGPENERNQRGSTSRETKDVQVSDPEPEQVRTHRFGNGTIFYVLIFLYVVCRVYLLAEIFASLRLMPQGVYNTVKWSEYFPHL